jgi:16S rRNA (guanine1207-N2)-methyltransferase
MTALQTLLHPFEAGLLPLPGDGARAIVFNARPGMRRPEGFRAGLSLVQGFRPYFLALERSGHDVAPEPQGDGYDLALVLAGRHRGQNERWIAQALERTVLGGLILVAGSKDDGIASLRKRIGELVPLEGALPKYHGIAFWFRCPADDEAARSLLARNPEIVVEGRFRTASGMFSADAVDPGSRLLADSLPDDLRGRIADFCAGWGYLAARLAGRDNVGAIDLYEADYEALQAAKRNLADVSAPVGFHWHDLAAEPVAARYDAIVMNPPFHRGRAAEPDLGLRMIAAARSALKKGGRLLLVANRPLPYERELAAGFAASGEVTRDARYKVLWAER